MARLGRSYAKSRLSPPAVVGPAVVFRRPQVNLAVRIPQQRVRTKPAFRGPAVVAQATVFAPLDIALAGRTRLEQSRHAAHSKLNPPATLAPPVQPPTAEQLKYRTRLTKIRPPAVRSRLAAPAVVAPAVTFRPVQIVLAASSRLARAAHSKLRPPTVTASATTFPPATVKLTAGRVQTRHRRTRSFQTALPPPTVVVQALLIPMRVALAAALKRTRVAHSRLTPPQTVGPSITFAPLQTKLAGSRVQTRHRRTRSFQTAVPLTPVVAPSILAAIAVKLAAGRVQTRHRPTRSFFTPAPLFPVVPPLTIDQLKTRVFLTRRGPVRLVQSKLRPPTAVAPGLVFAPVKMTLAPSTKLGRGTHSKLRPPVAISFPVTREQRIIHLYLAPQPKQGRRTMWRLQPPTVIGAFVNLAPPYLEGDAGDTDLEGRSGALIPAGMYGSSDLEGTPGVSG